MLPHAREAIANCWVYRKGVRTRCWTTGVVREGVRMYGKDDVELAQYALEEGMGAGHVFFH